MIEIFKELFCCNKCLKNIEVRSILDTQTHKNKAIFILDETIKPLSVVKINVRGEPNKAETTVRLAELIERYSEKTFELKDYYVDIFVEPFKSDGIDDFKRLSMSSKAKIALYKK